MTATASLKEAKDLSQADEDGIDDEKIIGRSWHVTRIRLERLCTGYPSARQSN